MKTKVNKESNKVLSLEQEKELNKIKDELSIKTKEMINQFILEIEELEEYILNLEEKRKYQY